MGWVKYYGFLETLIYHKEKKENGVTEVSGSKTDICNLKFYSYIYFSSTSSILKYPIS